MNQTSETALEGRLESITFYNEENHFVIGRLRSSDTKGLVSILGYMPDPNPGESLRVKGNWQSHPRYGQQFRFDFFEVLLPATVDEIVSYLQSGFIKGIGPKKVARIAARFKEDTLQVIENHPERLAEIKGIGPATAKHIAQEWQNHHAARSLMRFLQENGLQSAYGAKLMSHYGHEAEQILRTDPFRLTVDFPRIGFFIADRVIQNSNLSIDPEQRARACLRHLLEQAGGDGNVFEYENNLLSKARNLFQIDTQDGSEALLQLERDNEIVIDSSIAGEDGRAVYPVDLYEAERTIATRLSAALSIPGFLKEIDADEIAQTVLKALAIKLSDQQHIVLMGALSQKVAVITGGPGTGKTTLIQSITAVLESLGLRILLAAPTGRAARRISEVTRQAAATLHKMLGFCIEDGYFEKGRDNPLDADVVIVDEASMVDTKLFCQLLAAVPLTSRLILVGDVFQLPSVGPGNVLLDLVQSGVVPTFELTEIFRQAKESAIVVNSHRIRNGQMPETSGAPQEEFSDFYFIEQGRPEFVVNTIVELCTKEIPRRFSLNSAEQIQVLTPMHKGSVGTLNLNRVLQKHLNPNSEEIESMRGDFRPGDKVMHLRNNYNKEVFNGDIGTIVEFFPDTEKVVVDYYGRRVAYEKAELDELTLAYAISIHKSQGSEYPAVIIPILTQHYALLQRNLLYTAVTRGKQLVILIGTEKAISIALANDKPGKRFSGLAARLAVSCP